MPKTLMQLVAVTCLCVAQSVAAADTFPTQPINLVVAYPPGGSTDVAARLLAQDLGSKLGQSIVVENRSGAGGSVGTQYVVRAPADGHTLLFASSAELTVAAATRKTLPYQVNRDLEPVLMIAQVPFILVANNDFPANNVAELIAYTKANPSKVNFSSFGNGTSNHLLGEYFNLQADIHMTHIPYRGSAPSLQDLMGGQVQVTFDTITALMPLIQSGKVKPLAIATLERSSLVPDIPTISESGMPGFVGGTWFGIMAPKGTPAPVLSKLADTLKAALTSPALSQQLVSRGFIPTPRSGPDLLAYIQSETSKWTGVVEKIGLKLE